MPNLMDRTAVKSWRQYLAQTPWMAFVLAFVMIVLDQWSKGIVVAHFHYGEVQPVTSFFNLTLRYNYGVAFSVFDDAAGSQRWFLVALASLIALFVCGWMVHLGKRWTLELTGLALVLGGALGNVYDRVVLGYVVDFVELYARGYGAWPAFNVADMAISAGAAALIIDGLFLAKKRR